MNSENLIDGGCKDQLSSSELDDQEFLSGSDMKIQLKAKSFTYSKWKWVVLLCIWMMNFGNYYCFDSPNSLYDIISEKVLPEDNINYNYSLLYIVYAIPWMIFCLISGLTIVRYGLRVSVYFFMSTIIIGQLIFTIGGYIADIHSKSNDKSNLEFILSLIGRSIHGIGGDALTTCQFTFIYRWFYVQEMSFAFGINIAIVRISSVADNTLSPELASDYLWIALFVGFILWIVSFVFGVVANWFEGYCQKIDIKNKVINEDEIQKFHWKNIIELGPAFWYITANWFFTYISINSFKNVSNKYMKLKYHVSSGFLQFYIQNIYLLWIVISPLIGYFVDKKGHKMSLLILSNLMLII